MMALHDALIAFSLGDRAHVDLIAGFFVQSFQVFERNIGLLVEYVFDVFGRGCGRHVPFGNVSDTLGIFQIQSRNESDIAQCRTAEAYRYPSSGFCDHRKILGEFIQNFIGRIGKLFQVIFGIQIINIIKGNLS